MSRPDPGRPFIQFYAFIDRPARIARPEVLRLNVRRIPADSGRGVRDQPANATLPPGATARG